MAKAVGIHDAVGGRVHRRRPADERVEVMA